MRWSALLGLCAAAVLVIGAVASSASHAAATAHGWTRSGLGVVTQPAPVGSKFVFYAHSSGSLEVIALNARNGATAWSALASPSRVTAGQPVELAVRNGVVFYLEAAPKPYGLATAEVVARAAATDTVLWRSAVGEFTTVPEICPDQPAAICVNGVQGADHGELRFSATDGHRVALAPMGTSNFPGRELGPDLFDAGTRKPERLLAVNQGHVVWVRPISKIFTVPHASSDGGWDFDRFAQRGLFVGEVGVRPTIKNGRFSLNLGAFQTVGIRLANGNVAWRSKGTYSCHQPLPCPGQSLAGYTSAAPGPVASIGLRLLMAGRVSGSFGGGKPVVSRNASVTIQGLNLRTGKTRWSFAAGRNLKLMTAQGALPLLGPTTIVLKRGGREIALDLRNGKTRTAGSGAPAWCQRTIVYRLSHTAYYAGGGGRYAGQEAIYPCTIAGHRRALAAAVPPVVGLFGATTDGMTAWTDTGAVHARPSR